METKTIKVSEITVPKNGTRTQFDTVAIENLSKSIEKLGLLNPIVVVPKGKKYEIIAGRNRLEAVKLLKYKEITCTVSVEVGKETMLDMEIAENLQRDQLTLPDEIDLVRRFESDSLPAIAQRLSKTTDWVEQRTKLLVIPNEILQGCRDGFIKETVLPMFADIDPEQAITMLEEAREDNKRISSSAVEHATRYQRISYGDFDPMDEALNASGSCLTCPFNTSCTSLFPTIEDGYCTNPTCYEEKEELTVAAKIAETAKDYKLTMLHSRYADDDDTLTELGALVDVIRNIHNVDLEYSLKPTDQKRGFVTQQSDWVENENGSRSWEKIETLADAIERYKTDEDYNVDYFYVGDDGDVGYVSKIDENYRGSSTTKASGEEVIVNAAYISDEDSNKIGDNIAEIEKKQENYQKWEDGIEARENKWFCDIYQEWLSNVRLQALDKADDLPDFEVTVTGKDAPMVQMFFDTIRQAAKGWDDSKRPLINAAIITFLKKNVNIDIAKRKKFFNQYNNGVIAEYRRDIRAKKKKREGNMLAACEKMQDEIDAIRKLAMEKEAMDKEQVAQ